MEEVEGEGRRRRSYSMARFSYIQCTRGWRYNSTHF
jgi:hypothetical protein